MKNKLPTISIKNTATDDSSMIITVMHFSGILFVKVLINNAPNISAHWKGNNERQGKAKSMTTVLKNKDVYHVKNAIKLGQYNVGREGDILTIPLYMGFLVEDKLANVIIPDVDFSLLNTI